MEDKKVIDVSLDELRKDSFKALSDTRYDFRDDETGTSTEKENWWVWHEMKSGQPTLHKMIFLDNDITPDDCDHITYEEFDFDSIPYPDYLSYVDDDYTTSNVFIDVQVKGGRQFVVESSEELYGYIKIKELRKFHFKKVPHLLYEVLDDRRLEDLDPEHFDDEINLFASLCGFKRNYPEDELEDLEIETVAYKKTMELNILGTMDVYLTVNEDGYVDCNVEIYNQEDSEVFEITDYIFEKEEDIQIMLSILNVAKIVDDEDTEFIMDELIN